MMKAEYIKLLPISEGLRQVLLKPRKRIKLRTPEAVARRVKYKANKPKKSRIRCEYCNKRFIPKRSTKKFCTSVCRNKSYIQEHKTFKELGVYNQWYRLPVDVKKSKPQIELMRELLGKVA